MKRRNPVGWIVGGIVAFVLLAAVAIPFSVVTLLQSTIGGLARYQAENCTTTTAAISVAPAPVKVPSQKLKPQQIKNAETIIGVAQSRGYSRRYAVLGVQTAYQESRLYNLNYGDRDSRGLFQQRPSAGWGTIKQITTPVYATNKFYDAMDRIRNLDQKSLRTIAEQVQIPDLWHYRHNPQNNFNMWSGLAEELVSRSYKAKNPEVDSQAPVTTEACDPEVNGGMVDDSKLKKFMDTVVRQIGKPYVFGKESPTTGFDCSGLVLYAAKQVGFNLPRMAHKQYKMGKPVKREDLRPGDLVFWASNPSDPQTWHEGIYVGNDRMINARKPGTNVQFQPMYWDNFLGGRRLFEPSEQAPASKDGWINPLKPGSYQLTSPYGMRFHPVLRYWKLHDGRDMGTGGRSGDPIRAASSGVVDEAYFNTGYGNFVVIRHGGGVKTGYAHMTRYIVEKGQSVDKGEIIGYVGTTGYSTGNHLHFMFWENGKTVDPDKAMSKRGAPLNASLA